MKITVEAESLTDERLLPILKAASEMGQLVRVVCEIEPHALSHKLPNYVYFENLNGLTIPCSRSES